MDYLQTLPFGDLIEKAEFLKHWQRGSPVAELKLYFKGTSF